MIVRVSYSTPARATRDGAPDARSICRFVDSTVGRASHDTEIVEAHNVSDRPQLALSFWGGRPRRFTFRSRRCDLTCANCSSMGGRRGRSNGNLKESCRTARATDFWDNGCKKGTSASGHATNHRRRQRRDGLRVHLRLARLPGSGRTRRRRSARIETPRGDVCRPRRAVRESTGRC